MFHLTTTISMISLNGARAVVGPFLWPFKYFLRKTFSGDVRPTHSSKNFDTWFRCQKQVLAQTT